jgi:hypothetical protein
MSGIFISYRRHDSGGYAGRISDRLRADFGGDRVFRDVDTIPGGARFQDEIEKHLETCNVMLVIIGPAWLNDRDETGRRRLDDPADLVRIEIRTALRYNVCLIPVTVGGAPLPAAKDLPEDLRNLVQFQQRDLRDGDTWNSDLQLLVRRVANELGVRNSKVRLSAFVTVGLVVLITLGGLYVVRSRGKVPLTLSTISQGPARASTAAPSAIPPPSAPTTTMTVAGKWITPLLTNPYADNEHFTLRFDFELFGDKLTGSITESGDRSGIFEGKVRGNVVSFYTQSEVLIGNETKPYKTFYDGRVIGDRIEFIRQDDLSIGGVPLKFVATRHLDR